MFKKLLASAGFGSAQIDLILHQDSLVMGEPVIGRIVLQGGDVEQEIEGLSVEFCLASSFKRDNHYEAVDEVIAHIEVTSEIFTIAEGETREFPFHFKCPKLLPVSSLNTRYYFQTNMEIKYGLDSYDRDCVEVKPIGLQKNFLDGFIALGFVHHAEGYTGNKNGGTQIIKFRPTTWLKGKYDGIVFMYQPNQIQNTVSGFFELDQRTQGLSGSLADKLDLDERKGRFHFTKEELSTVERASQTIKQFIIENSINLIG
ncbi:sporulation protein [Thermoflavimicrobium daqui]|nr:sporulation protein [Thermoflavimicrobium daqui]